MARGTAPGTLPGPSRQSPDVPRGFRTYGNSSPPGVAGPAPPVPHKRCVFAWQSLLSSWGRGRPEIFARARETGPAAARPPAPCTGRNNAAAGTGNLQGGEEPRWEPVTFPLLRSAADTNRRLTYTVGQGPLPINGFSPPSIISWRPRSSLYGLNRLVCGRSPSGWQRPCRQGRLSGLPSSRRMRVKGLTRGGFLPKLPVERT
jgi:hypothetical protein